MRGAVSVFMLFCLCTLLLIYLMSPIGFNTKEKPIRTSRILPASYLEESGENGRVLVVGDVHGCFEELQELLSKCNYRSSVDQLVFVGDILGKGPLSLQVVDFAMKQGALCVRGNHEQVVISWYQNKPANTPKLKPSYLKLAQSLSPQHWNYLLSCPLYLEIPEYDLLVVHAGIDPSVGLDEQDSELMMNMRNRKSNGQGFTSVYEDGTPWIVFFGHDAKRGLQDRYRNETLVALGLDSGVVYGGQLSAYALPDHQLVQVQAKRVYKEP